MPDANPYNYNLPVEPAMFFGRDADVAALAQKLTGAPGDSIALVGGRRMGKTSMLEALRRALEVPAADMLALPILLDLSGEGLDSADDLFRLVAEQARDALAPDLALPPIDPALFGPGQPPAPAFRRLLEGWGRAALARRGARLRLILLLDECEEIVEQPWAADLHTALRALLVGQSTRALLKVVMAGSHRFLTQVRQRGSPLWNVLVYHMLAVLGDTAARALLSAPAAGHFAEPAVAAILEQSGGQPFLTQYLAYQLWSLAPDRATPEAARQAAAAFQRERHDFADWADGLGVEGLRVYAALAEAGALSEAELRARLPAQANLPQLLDALCYHGVAAVASGGARFQVAGAMFRDWFAANSPAPRQASPPPLPPEAIEDKRRRLKLLERQQAQHGIQTPPHIVIEIEDLRRELASLPGAG